MAEYINRESFFKFLTGQMTRKQNGAFAKGFNKGIMVARAAVHNKEITPSADVVEVVRCRDCKYFYEVTSDDKSMGYGYCDIPNDEVRGDGRRVPNDFCSYGERRSE